MRVPLTIVVGFCVSILAGCGNSRTPVPSQAQAAAPDQFDAVDNAGFSPLRRSVALLHPGTA